MVNDEDVAKSEVGDAPRRRPQESIESVIAMASDDNEVDIEFVGDLEDESPRLAHAHDGRADGRARSSCAQSKQGCLGLLFQVPGQRVRPTSRGRRRILGGYEDRPKGMKSGLEAGRYFRSRVKDTGRTRGPVEGDQHGPDHVGAPASGVWGAAASSSGIALLAKKTNITGTRKSDKTVEDVNPPTTASASG